MHEKKQRHRIFYAFFQLKLLKIRGKEKTTRESIDE